MKDLAIAGAYRNNCAFHCLANCLFTLNDDDLKSGFKKNTQLTPLMIHFYEYYGLGDNYDVDKFMAFLNKMPHPADREILWGQVLRTFFKNLGKGNNDFKDYDLSELNDGNLVSDDLFAKCANQFGCSICIHADEKQDSDFDLKYEVMNPILNLDIYHTSKGGGHYNFTYIDDQMNYIHNEQFSPPDKYGQCKPIGQSFLYGPSNCVGTKVQENAIRNEVQKQFRIVTQEMDKKSASKFNRI